MAKIIINGLTDIQASALALALEDDSSIIVDTINDEMDDREAGRIQVSNVNYNTCKDITCHTINVISPTVGVINEDDELEDIEDFDITDAEFDEDDDQL